LFCFLFLLLNVIKNTCPLFVPMIITLDRFQCIANLFYVESLLCRIPFEGHHRDRFVISEFHCNS
jgi:hypothetical protein